MSGLVSVKTYWIDRNGDFSDPSNRVGRIGEDVTVFAIHSLGWARIMEIGGFAEFQFDSHATGPAAIRSIMAYVHGRIARGAPWLGQFEAYDGFQWRRLVSHDLSEIQNFLATTQNADGPMLVPSSIAKRPLDRRLLNSIRDPGFRSLYRTWQSDPVSVLDLDALPMPFRGSASIVVRRDDGQFGLRAFRCGETAGPWGVALSELEAVPPIDQAVADRGLAGELDRSYRGLWDLAVDPVLERWTGLVQLPEPDSASETGMVRDIDWARIVLPVMVPDPSGPIQARRRVGLPAPIAAAGGDSLAGLATPPVPETEPSRTTALLVITLPHEETAATSG